MTQLDPGLDPGIAATLERLAREDRWLGRLPVEEERASYRSICIELSGPPPAGVVTRDLVIGNGSPTRFYLPPTSAAMPTPCLLFFHGGGGVIGDVAAYDSACRTLCARSGVAVLSVEYRLAPEHPAAASFDDAEAATRWTFEHAEAPELGLDPQRLAVGGDSQGGLIAATVAQRCRDLPLALQLLIYPGLGFDAAAAAPFLDGYFLDSTAISAFTGHLRAAGGPSIAELMPHGSDLTGAAPAYIATAGFDLLTSGVPSYLALLDHAGVPAEHESFPTLIHGFLTMSAASDVAAAAVLRIADALRDGLTRPT